MDDFKMLGLWLDSEWILAIIIKYIYKYCMHEYWCDKIGEIIVNVCSGKIWH